MRIKIAITLFAAMWLIFLSSEIISKQFAFFHYLAAYGKLLTGNICHQSPQKLFLIGDAESLVCSRCFGIYFGGFIATILLFFKNIVSEKQFKILFIASLLMLLDVMATTFGIYNYTRTTAFITGLFFGSITGIFIFSHLLKKGV